MSGAASAQLGVKGSKHDLGKGVNDNREVCVYCHTPHGGNADVDAPLWNKPAGMQAYRTYDSATIDGRILPVGSVSTACLSCHDGTQAMDTVINAPGSGLRSGRMGSGVGAMSPNIIANLGVDLRNDHPVGVQYGGFNDGRGQIDPDFVNSATGLQSAIMLGRMRWWVDTEQNSERQSRQDRHDPLHAQRRRDGPALRGMCHVPRSASRLGHQSIVHAAHQQRQ